MEIQEYDGEERRALNMIWTAAKDHSFQPAFMAFDKDGKADVYLNSIIGYAGRWYDGALLSGLFDTFQGTALQEVYDTILWLGLESGAYEKERGERPVLESLRREYWERVLLESRWAAGEKLVQALQTGRGRMVLGEKPGLTAWERGILNRLSFGAFADTEQIVDGVSGLLWEYFRFDCKAERRKTGRRKNNFFPFRFFRPARSVIVKNSLPGGGDGEDREKENAGGNADIPDQERDRKGISLRFWLEAPSQRREEAVRSYLNACYGISMYGDTQNRGICHMLCTGGHMGCRLHFTKGERFLRAPRDKESDRRLWEAGQQRKKNREHFERHQTEYQCSIRRLKERIRNTLLVDLQPVSETGRQGRLMGDLAWRAVCLEDDRVFLRTVEEERGNVSVDLMLDASASRMGHEEVISAQGYVIAESLTRCGIPVRVYSFSTIHNYTVFRIFRGYGEPEQNREILGYVADGWNRDGLALRAAGYLIRESPCERRLLIVLTDASPNDEQRLASEKGGFRGKEYGGEAGIEDTASEVRRLRKQGVKVMAVFYGLDSDLKGARQIYGSSFVRIRDMGQLADAVGNLIDRQLKEGR